MTRIGIVEVVKILVLIVKIFVRCGFKVAQMLLVVRKVFVGHVAVFKFGRNGALAFHEKRIGCAGYVGDLAFTGYDNALAVGYVIEVYKGGYAFGDCLLDRNGVYGTGAKVKKAVPCNQSAVGVQSLELDELVLRELQVPLQQLMEFIQCSGCFKVINAGKTLQAGQ